MPVYHNNIQNNNMFINNKNTLVTQSLNYPSFNNNINPKQYPYPLNN